MTDDELVEILVYLPEEAVDTWRPVKALRVDQPLYRILSENQDAENERWEFSTGDTVRCAAKVFFGGERRLVAVERMAENLEARDQGRFADLPLHDAQLHDIQVLWEQRVCRIRLSAFAVQGKDAVPHLLEFLEVTDLRLPHEAPWGPSVFVNEGTEPSEGHFRIMMQSGDGIDIRAARFTFRRSIDSSLPTSDEVPRL